MRAEHGIILGILLGFVLLEILFTRFFNKQGQSLTDALVEIVSTSLLLALTQPIVLLLGGMLAAWVWPEGKDILLAYPLWVSLILLLIFDDMMQYWWHRLSHSVPALYKLHRPHHNASYMSIRIVYRNNSFYYFFMPSLWFSGALIYMGAVEVYLVYIIVKMSVIYGAHSDIRWDEKLYQIKALKPVMWVLERTISTPATHAAHHGKYADDPATNYKGNYGNLLFFWDVLFGTAKITRTYPKEFGVENLPDTSLGEQLLWPIIRKS